MSEFHATLEFCAYEPADLGEKFSVHPVELVGFRTVGVQYADDLVLEEDWHDDFRPAQSVACNMAWKPSDIRYDDGAALFPGCSANTLPESDLRTGYRSLERPEGQAVSVNQIESHPEESAGFFQRRSNICHTRNRTVGGDQRSYLSEQLVVYIVFSELHLSNSFG